MNNIFPFTLFCVTACGNDNVIEKQQNSAPTVTIMSHGDGAEFQDGFVEYFRAVVSDDDNEFDELSVAWYVGEELVCDWEVANPAGESTCEIVFEEGDDTVITEVRDQQGAGGRSEISIVVLPTEAPEIELLTPISGNTYYSNQLIQFSALVSDAEDEPEELIVSWTSSADGELPLDNSINADGEISDYTYLTEGNHAIELRVEDSTGKVSTEEVVIQVGGENNEPNCAFTAPNSEDAFVVGESVIFSGTATDEDIPNSDLTVEISSNLDGVFQNLIPNSDGTFSFATNVLTSGTHTVTLLATDEVGAECRTSILVSIGNAPMASIDEPLDGTVFSVGETVTFRGTISDSEDQANQIAVVWNSDIEGELQAGTPNAQGVSQFTRSDLSAGVHSVSLSATDTSGLIADDLISFRVNNLPTVDSITLSPNPVYADDDLVVTATGSDVDGQTVTMTYAWFENGVATGFTGTSINASELQVGETWTVRVTPNDGFQDGAHLEEVITISNRTPTIPTATITWSGSGNTPVAGDSLTCTGSGSTDPDGQSVSYIYTWMTNASGGPSTGQTVGASFTSVGDTWTCSAVATDGMASSSAGVDSVTIASSCGLTNCDTNLDLGDGQSIDMVLVPNGTFTMGSPSNEVGRDSDEEQHQVTLTNDYYVMTTEVTQGMFFALMGYNAHDGQTTSNASGSYGIGNDYPAYYVNWHMAAAFANEATQRHNSLNGTNLQECYSCSGLGGSVSCLVSVDPYQCTGYRMLTEAEWEYAARAGTTDAVWTLNGGGNIPSGFESSGGCSESWTLSDGTILGDMAWFCGNDGNNNLAYPYGSKEVASRDPNGYDIYDMSGNLAEWTQDWYGAYSTGSVTNPTGGTNTFTPVVRGGYWFNVPSKLRSADRLYSGPTIRFTIIGFRLSRIAP